MAVAKMQKIPEGTVIIREGEKSEVMYKILKGHAELYLGYGTPTESLLGIIGEQSCFGEFGLLLKKPAIYTVIAYSDLLVMRIGEEDMADFIKENYKNVRDIMMNMANSMMTMRMQMELLTQELNEKENSDRNNKAIKDNIRNAKQLMRAYAVKGFQLTPG